MQLRDVTKVYGAFPGKGATVGVEHLSLTVEPGEIFVLLGPNGAGKTTTMKMLAGLVTPTSGQIHVGGFDVVRRRHDALSKLGVMLGDSRSVYWRLTVRDNLEYFGALRGMTGARARVRISCVSETLGLTAVLPRRAGDLSRGMCQRLALAIALLPDPEILVLDEPTAGLDVASRRELRALLREVAAERRRTVVLATHQMDEVEALAHRVCILRQGRMVALDTVSALLGRGGDEQGGRPARWPDLEEAFLRMTAETYGPEGGSCRPDPGERNTSESPRRQPV